MTRAPTPFDVVATPIESGVTLIEASAGTGKTYCLTRLVLRLLLEGHAKRVGEILVMTFTIAATAELVGRIRTTLRKAIRVLEGERDDDDPFFRSLAEQAQQDGGAAKLAILEAALRDLDDLQVSTIHGFCRRVLAENAFESGAPFDVEYVENADPLLARAAEDFWRRTMYPAGDLVAAVATHLKWAPNAFVKDYYACHSHPGIAIEPSPRPLDVAIAELREAAAAVEAAWTGNVRAAFDAPRFASGKRYSDEHFSALEAFCVQGRVEAVGAALDSSSAKLRKRLTDVGKRELQVFPFCAACDRLAEAAAALAHALRAAFVRDIDDVLESEKRRAHVAGFDDLLHRLHGALADPQRRRALQRAAGDRFAAVLVDEFQDTDVVQYEIFRSLFTRPRLFLIGDPKQSIYAFRGADVFAYIRAKDDAAHRYTLDRNWRSETPLVEAVNAVFERAERPFVFEKIPFQSVGAAGRADGNPIAGDGRRALEWVLLPDASNKEDGRRAASRAAAHEIATLLAPQTALRIGDTPIEPKYVAVLVRTNRQAEQVQEVLRAAGIPAVVSQAGNVLQTDEARELRTLLTAVASPHDEGAVRAALATRAWAFGADTIAKLTDDDQEWQSHVDALEELGALWRRKGFAAMAEQLLTISRARTNLLAGAGGERRLTNLLHLLELAHGASAEQHLSPDAVLGWLVQALKAPLTQRAEISELRLESDADAVQIVTIHKAKGLEYDVVLCPFLWDGHGDASKPPFLVHLQDGSAVYHCADPADEARAHAFGEEALSEEARLVYVALTRARHRCYVAAGQIGTSSRSALSYLLAADDAVGWRAQIEKLCRARPGSMALSEQRSGEVVAPRELARATAPLAARELGARARAQLVPWRVASFSSFRAPLSVDAAAEAAGLGLKRKKGAKIALPAVAPGPELPDHGDPALARPDDARAPSGMFAFARGPRAGNCLHEILERCDFTAAGDARTVRLVAETLARNGLDTAALHGGSIAPAATVLAMLGDVMASTLPGARFTLAEVKPEQRLNEWQFYLPMGRVSQGRLADCFARHGSGAIKQEYPALLRGLGEREVEGFLMGFVDLVFTNGGRWYLVDWKSNHLGNDLGDYSADTIARAMRDHHYILQYHLYTVALHRYLSRRSPSRPHGRARAARPYDYERDFGGVYYCFLRAMRAGQPSGWYFDRPSFALIDALAGLIAGDSVPQGERAA